MNIYNAIDGTGWDETTTTIAATTFGIEIAAASCPVSLISKLGSGGKKREHDETIIINIDGKELARFVRHKFVSGIDGF